MADQRPNRGRARGRARGKPLVPEVSAQVAAAAASVRPKQMEKNPDSAANLPGSGRGVKRGSMHQADPGAGAGDAARGIGRMTLSGRKHVALLGSRRLDPAIFDPDTRPDHIKDKRGQDGNPVQIVTNYFRLNCRKAWNLFQYRVDYDPEIDHKGVRKGMLRQQTDLIGETYIFDGLMLYTIKKLPQATNVVECKKISDDSVVRITIKLTSELPPESPLSIQLYNILFRSVLEKLRMTQVGRHFYDPASKFTVQCRDVKLELWPGFITSILQHEQNVMLCAEVSHKLMRNDSVADVMRQLFKKFGNNRFREECEKFLIGQIVLTRYNNKTYRIDGILWDLSISKKFKKGEKEISYIDYYKEQYGATIRDANQPLLLSRPKSREVRKGLEAIHLVPELCTVTGLSDELRADFHSMKALGEHTKQGPVKRVEALTRFIGRISDNKEVAKLLEAWGLRFERSLMNITGRIMPTEDIMFGKGDRDPKNRTIKVGPNASWDSEFRRCKMLRCVELRCWRIICMNRDNGTANNLASKMIQVSQTMGFIVAKPQIIPVQSDRFEAYRGAILDIISRVKDCQLVCCLLPNNRKDRYDSIKKLCCVDMPIPTQVVLSRTLSKPERVMSVATKIAIQINCKLGGEAWACNIPLKNTMIIGIDTYHDSAQKGQSVGGFVASINRGYTRWYSNTTFQHTGGELVDGLKRCMTGKIFVFRDGVGDGQLDTVRDHEVTQMLQCLEIPSCPEYKAQLAYIVVKKRINTRLFMKGGRGLVNPSPGTVVDDVVTRPGWYDFFIVSQSVREGTVSPTHYNVIFDTCGLPPNHMQRLAFKLCHAYYNWPGTVRVPAPCLYAHKLAFLVGQSIHRPPAPALSDKLYFL